jgi:hypothetical protein
MSNVAEYLLSTALVQWRIAKKSRTPESVAQLAQQLGYTMGPSISINVERYSLSQFGRIVKEGKLDTIAWYLNKHAEGNL